MNWLHLVWLAVGFAALLSLGWLGVGWLRAKGKTIGSSKDVSESAFLFTLTSLPYYEGETIHTPELTAFQALQTGVECAFVDIRSARLLITSCMNGEGKSYVAVTLATGLAKSGQRVLLVDGNLSRPVLAQLFKLPASPGLVELLAAAEQGQTNIMDFVQPTGIENLSLLAAGVGPAANLATVRQIVDTAATYFHYIIIDGPTILAGEPPIPFYAQYIILVTHTGRVKKRDFQGMIRHLHQNGANILGVVLNQPKVVVPVKPINREWLRSLKNKLGKVTAALPNLSGLVLVPASVPALPGRANSHHPSQLSSPPPPLPLKELQQLEQTILSQKIELEGNDQHIADLKSSLQLANAWHNLNLTDFRQQFQQLQHLLSDGLLILQQQETALEKQQSLCQAWRQKAKLGDEAINQLLRHKNQLTTELELAVAENNQFIEDQRILTSKNHFLTAALEQVRAEQSALRQRFEQTQRELTYQLESRARLTQEVEQAQAEIARLSQEWEKSLTVQASLNQWLIQIEGELASKSQQLELARVEKDGLSQALLTTQAKLTGRDAELAAVRRKLQDISKLYQRYQTRPAGELPLTDEKSLSLIVPQPVPDQPLL